MPTLTETLRSLHRIHRQHSDLKVYVDAPGNKCLDRRIERDMAERGRTYASIIEQYRTYTQPMADEYVIPSRTFADIVVSGDRSVEEAVAEIIRHLSHD